MFYPSRWVHVGLSGGVFTPITLLELKRPQSSKTMVPNSFCNVYKPSSYSFGFSTPWQEHLNKTNLQLLFCTRAKMAR